MAEFCKQCAGELDFPADFTDLFSQHGIVPDGMIGFNVLCETCGTAFIIDNEGTCGSEHCDGHMGAPGPHGRGYNG